MSIVTVAGQPLTEAEWLARRRHGIGASEAAAALGLDPYRSPLELWAVKCGKIASPVQSVRMRAGKAMEPLIAQLYQEKGGNPITQQQVYVAHPDYPLHATLDAVDDTDGVVEFKTVGERQAQRWGLTGSDADDLPERWVVQVHQQMALWHHETNTPPLAASVAVLIGGATFWIYTVEWSQAIWDACLPKLLEFWGHVERQEPPPFVTADLDVLRTIYPPTPDEYEGGELERSAVDLYEELGKLARDTAERRDAVKAELLAATQGRQCRLPDGRRIDYRTIHRAAYTVPAGSYQTLTIRKGRAT